MVLTKVRMSYPLGKNEPVVNHLLFMYDFKQFAKSERLIPEGRQCKNGWNVVLDFQVCSVDYEERKEVTLLWY